MYWTERKTIEDSEPETTIYFAPTPTSPTSTSREPTMIGRVTGEVSSLALHTNAIYFAIAPPGDARAEIRRIPRRGGRDELVLADAGVERLALDATHVYWISGGGQLGKVELATKRATALADNVEYSYPSAFAIDDTNVFFSNDLADAPNRIYRIPKAGGDVVRMDDAGGVDGWALAGPSLFYSWKGAIWRVDNTATEPKPQRLDVAGSPRLLAIDADRMFYVDADNQLHERSITTGKPATLATRLVLGDDIVEITYAAGAIWFVRDLDSDSDSDSNSAAEISMYVP